MKTVNPTIEFTNVPLTIIDVNRENLFSQNTGTLRKFYEHSKFKNVLRLHGNLYEENLDQNFGEFLLSLKQSENDHYKHFLHKHGDETFCKFKIQHFLYDKGLYCYSLKNKILYIGKTFKTFGERINNNYGSVSPYTCTKNGQSTNCRINSKVNEHHKEIKFGVYVMNDSTNAQIALLEKNILKSGIYSWNTQLQKRPSH